MWSAFKDICGFALKAMNGLKLRWICNFQFGIFEGVRQIPKWFPAGLYVTYVAMP